MMNVQLLLLLALAGPFCAFTHASPTEIPSDLDVSVGVTEAPKEDLTIITGPPATEPAAVPAEVVTVTVANEEVVTEEATVVTESAPPAVTVNIEEAVVDTEAPTVATQAPEALITDPPVVETGAPTSEVDVQPTEAAKAETGEEVVVEDDTDEGLSSGQVVGIVIGALLVVVIVIAVVIAAVRRMGIYSP
ncbi:podoplanin [Cottoperca gobio]|uniref:Podoplanin n=1 Tax=Cottoperca gobio TaxID=56716 RepID=A0A6J2Q3A4_COTGO|nr:fibrous sheath CABYR-binding protein-like [Cottoperca gobio]